MIHAHIALALELLAMASGALLILSCCRACHADCCRDRSGNPPLDRDGNPIHEKNKSRKHYGFLKFIGYFTLILAFLGLICTSIHMASRYSRMQAIEDRIEENYHLRDDDAHKVDQMEDHNTAVPVPVHEDDHVKGNR